MCRWDRWRQVETGGQSRGLVPSRANCHETWTCQHGGQVCPLQRVSRLRGPAWEPVKQIGESRNRKTLDSRDARNRTCTKPGQPVYDTSSLAITPEGPGSVRRVSC
ncbi:hypothetical protein Bbelb_267030 [Branchiostoma belcheri]|nr:hypothetical protein Bbelb_267030 [Branchiostoma belcheri]